MESLRALPGFLTPDAFLHYLPAYLATAISSPRWGEDHFDAIVGCLVPAGRVAREAAHDELRVGALTVSERLQIADVLEQVVGRRGWTLDHSGRAAIKSLRGPGRDVEPPPPDISAASESAGAWDWIGELRDEIERTFAIKDLPTADIVRDPRHCTDCRGAYRVLAGNAWNRVPASELWPEKAAIFEISPQAFAAYLPTYLWVALETSAAGGEVRATLTYCLDQVCSRRDDDRSWSGERWRSLTSAERVVAGRVLLGIAGRERRAGDPDASGTESIGRRWIDESDAN
jgi:hypothetical protein